MWVWDKARPTTVLESGRVTSTLDSHTHRVQESSFSHREAIFSASPFRNELPVISRLIWERCVRSPEPTRVSCEGVIEPQLFPDNNHLGMNRGGEIDHEVTDESVQFVQCREREPVVLIELISF